MLETIPFPSFEEMRQVIDDKILKDSRSKEPQKYKLSKLQTLYGIKLNRSSLYKVHATITGRGGLDATTISELKQDNSILAKFGEKKLLVSDVAYALPTYTQKVRVAALLEFDRIANEQSDLFTEEIVRIQLAEFPEYLKFLDE